MRSLITAAAALALAVPAITTDSSAAIPRETELALQAKAPERLHIEIVKVSKRRKASTFNVTATAKVLKVERTGSAVAVGSEIKLSYSTPAVPIPSAPPGLIEKGAKYSAFLKKIEGSEYYRDAAASGTFEPIAPIPVKVPTPTPAD